VSRTPVREALFRLEREGYVEVHAKSGWSVRALDFDALDHLYDVRVILECEAVRKLCAGDPRPALVGLSAVWLVPPRMRLADGGRVARLDEEFHWTVVAAAGNPELARMHQGITERIRIVRRLDFTHPERIIYTYLEHAQILRAVLARNAARASKLLRAHIEASKTEVRKISLHRLHLAHLDARGRP
jgi:DNA-binding GntR family transcriptional regulator